MRYDLCTSESKEKIGDIILDKEPQKDDRIYFENKEWRIDGAVWQRDALDKTNSVPSGLLRIEPIDK